MACDWFLGKTDEDGGGQRNFRNEDESGENRPALLQRQAGVSRLGAAEMWAVAGRIEQGGTEIVVAPFNALPDRIKEEATKLGTPAEAVRVVHDQGTAYPVEDRFESEANAEEAIFHELYHKWIGGIWEGPYMTSLQIEPVSTRTRNIKNLVGNDRTVIVRHALSYSPHLKSWASGN